MTRAAAGFSVVALVTALCAALYVAFDVGALGCGRSVCADVAASTLTLAWAVLAAAVLGLVVLLARLRLLTRIGALLAAAGLVTLYVRAGGLPTWTAYLAAYAGVAGLVAAALGAGARVERTRPVVLGALVAVLAGGAFAVPRTWFVDATHAAVQPIPPTPATLGTERFRIEAGFGGGLVVEPAGAGFVVLAPNSGRQPPPPVIAYGGDGRERWRYGRRDLEHYSGLSDLAVYDEGRIVVTRFSSRGSDGELIGLDAMTGVVLWTSDDPELLAAFEEENGVRWPLLVHRTFDQWTRFDPRTGAPAWQVPSPVPCRARSPLDPDLVTERRVDSEAWVASVVDCSTPDRVDLRYVALDPDTGAVVRSGPLSGANRLPRGDVRGWSPVLDADVIGVDLFTASNPSPDVPFVDLATGRDVAPPADELRYRADPGSGDYVTTEADTATLHGADGVPRCTFAVPPHAVAWGNLGAQVVIVDRGLRAFDRATCADEGTVALPDVGPLEFAYLETVPGAMLAVLKRDERSRAVIVGYAP